ncbi:nuclear pore complex protein NUP1 isoform X3 [Camellia sinensis]|uniref:nuclear pore complex protein NUP1 isoform X3 n=1 Tax=Camellia sinensis TaxID=4442 RepID=UPI001035927A|nr:nuclear pore complex protein NUP1 isoform X3 [Camellia sinensis]
MASTTAGEGTSYGGEGGGGGKFRKKPFRGTPTKPYDRPPQTVLPNPRNNGWLPKLVDPASKLIFASARMFFSSVFRKRLAPPPPPPPPPEVNQESRDKLQGAAPNNPLGMQGPASDGGNPTNSSDGSGISELEQILKQKTFTRSEVDRLTELLHSKTVDLPNGDEYKRSESNVPQPSSAFERQDEYASNPIQANGNETHLESHRLHGPISTPVVLDEDVATPAELAKAYMGGRPSKVSPSMLGLRSQPLREDANLLNNVPFRPQSPVMSLVPKPAVRVGVSENGFMTPRSRGRSAIYSMARTPYSRVNPTATQKGSTYDGYGGPSASSSSHFPWKHDSEHGSKQLVLKRRSSVLEDDIGSIGPIRRLRQKTTLSTPKNVSLPVSRSPLSSFGTGVGYDATQPSSTQKLVSLDEPKHRTSKTVGENEHNSIPSTSYTPVPSKSTEMATRILQQLEKLVPKEKSSEGKIVSVREKSPSKLMPNMLRGQALRSLEDVDSSKILHNAKDNNKLEDMHNTCLPDARDTSSQKQDKVEENGPKKFVSREMFAPAVISNTTISVKDTVIGVKTADSILTPSLTQRPQKKQAFQMSAHEVGGVAFLRPCSDFLELDDEIHSNEAASIPLAEGKEILEISVAESKAAASEAVTVNKTPVLPEIMPSASPVMKKSADLGTTDASVANEKNTGFSFSTAPASSPAFQPVVATPQSSSVFDRIVPLEEPNAAPPLFSSNYKSVDKVPSLTFSFPSSVSESFGQKSSAPLESKVENSNSFINVASGADTVPKFPELVKGDKDAQKSGAIMTSSSPAASTSTSASSIFSFGAPANNSSLSNGSLASSPSIFSSPAPVLASSHFTNQTVTNSFSNVASSTTATMSNNGNTLTTSLNSSVSTSVAAPSFPAAPIFKFGSTSVAPSNSVSAVSSSGAETTDLKAKTEKETTFGNLSSSPFGGTSFGTASTGSSSIFGFSASSTSTANNQSQGSLFGTSGGTGVATVTQSMPIHFGSSASPPVFGTSGTISFTSSSSLFGSSSSTSSLFSSSTSSSSLFGSSTASGSVFGSSTTPNVFGSSTSFGLSSSASSSETNSISTSGSTSSLFNSTWQPTKPSFNSTFSSASPSTGFSFGASSVSVAATNSAPMVFGSSTPTSGSLDSIFMFTSAASTATASSQAQPMFGSAVPVFTAASGNGDQMSMEDSMAEDPVQASIMPAVPVFGQPPISAPSSGFMFGSTAPSPGLAFQFGSQQPNQSAPQNPSLFQSSGSLEFGAGDSFSLGSGATTDKSGRKIVKVKHKNRKK